MQTIDVAAALRILRQDEHRHFSEVLSLDRNMPPVPKKLFGNSHDPTSLLLVEQFPHGVSATITVCDEQFVRDCIRWLAASYGEFGLCSFDRCVFDVLDSMGDFNREAIGCRRSFVCTSIDRVPDVNTSVRRLAEEDLPLVEGYPENRGNQPGLAQFFQWSVHDGRGEVYGALEGRQVLGYLCCDNDYRNVWDVGFIHVRPERRREGIGLQLAAAYARDKLNAGQVPYWSSAANEASERTALKAGFVCCRELLHASVVKQTDKK